jgi:hypothetical protein
MPDPVLLLLAMAAAAGAGALCALALGGPRQPAGAGRRNAALVLAIAVGMAVGYELLQLRPIWPPATALNRLLAIVFPAVFAVELLAGFPRVPGWLAWLLRLTLALSVARILLHGSVYLDAADGEWTAGQAVAVLALAGMLLAGVWLLLARLQHRTPGVSIPLALSLSILSGGIAVMLAGYRSGGEAAFPPAAALAGAAVASSLIGNRLDEQHGAIGVGVVALFGLLFIGRYFGGLSTERALALLLAPLLCGATALPPWQSRPRLAAALGLALVVLWLGVVLAGAHREFERKMGPLMGATPATGKTSVCLTSLLSARARRG